MRVVAFNTSPRPRGNTFDLLTALLESARAGGLETELVQVGGEPLQGCTACMACKKNKDRECVLRGDRFNEHFARMLAAEAVVIGSPTYFADLTAEAKALIDRAGYVAMANGGLLSRKVGAGVVAVRRAGAIHVLDSINHLFLVSRMIVPGSTYWNLGIGRNEGEAAADEEGMRNMADLGATIAWLVKALAAAKE